MFKFTDFLTRADRENKRHLNTLRKILLQAGFKIQNHLNDSKEPYIYVRRPDHVDEHFKKLSFGGLRLYTRGKDMICYRVQNKEDTEPYGSAYILNVKEMFRDLMKDGKDKKIGLKIIFTILQTIYDFFSKSCEAEEEKDIIEPSPDPMNRVIMRSTGTDYANTVHDLNRH